MEFKSYPKIGRLSRDCLITEKIDGTNAGVYIGEDGEFLVASRSRWITPENDNYGFARWAYDNKEQLMLLGPGMHHGEWWGRGIQRNYAKTTRTFSLFNSHRWTADNTPSCCSVVAPGFMQPEGVVVLHKATNTLFKKLLENDSQPKGT